MTASTMKHALILLFLTLITAHAQLGVSDSQRRVGGGGGYYNPEKFKPKTVQIRAEDLEAAYAADPSKADHLYKDSQVEVTGEISKTGTDPYGIFVRIGTVIKYYQETEGNLEMLSSLKPGQTVTLTGKCAGKSATRILIE